MAASPDPDFPGPRDRLLEAFKASGCKSSHKPSNEPPQDPSLSLAEIRHAEIMEISFRGEQQKLFQLAYNQPITGVLQELFYPPETFPNNPQHELYSYCEFFRDIEQETAPLRLPPAQGFILKPASLFWQDLFESLAIHFSLEDSPLKLFGTCFCAAPGCAVGGNFESYVEPAKGLDFLDFYNCMITSSRPELQLEIVVQVMLGRPWYIYDFRGCSIHMNQKNFYCLMESLIILEESLTTVEKALREIKKRGSISAEEKANLQELSSQMSLCIVSINYLRPQIQDPIFTQHVLPLLADILVDAGKVLPKIHSFL